MTDHVKNQLCDRIEELEKEKLELNEQLDALQKERDALAAHLEFCHKVLSMVENGPDYLVAKQYRALRMARERKPETSLARLKAQWQSDALQELYNTWKGEGMMRVGALLDKAIELQEEAEEARYENHHS